MFAYFFSFLVLRSRAVLKLLPTIRCIAESVSTAATFSQTCQAVMPKEAKFVMAQPDAVGCRAGCRNLRSGMW